MPDDPVPQILPADHKARFISFYKRSRIIDLFSENEAGPDQVFVRIALCHKVPGLCEGGGPEIDVLIGLPEEKDDRKDQEQKRKALPHV